MRLYNSKTQTTEEFSLRNSEVTLYVCGITPYDTTHIGHAFTYTAYDQLIRYLEMKGIVVRYAQNVNFTPYNRHRVKGGCDSWPQIEPGINTPGLSAA
jgi:tRNA synthetases class I (C) catalytic domain